MEVYRRDSHAVRIIRLPEVLNRVGVSRSSLYAMVKAGDFPNRISLGSKRSVGWLEHEVNDWIARQINNGGN